MNKIIQKLLGDMVSFLVKHLGFGTVLALALMGGVVIFLPDFIPQARQATIPAFALYPATFGNTETSNIKDFSLVGQPSPMDEAGVNSSDDFTGSMVFEKGSAIDTPAVSDGIERKNGMLIYKVAKGDVLSIIAKKFAVTTATIISTNNLKKSGLIRLGQELLIPNPKVTPVKNIATDSSLPDVKAHLSMPVKDGLNLGKLRGNAVDIMAVCGAPIYASADGMVEEVVTAPGSDSNGGYVKIKHQFNDVETIYAHTSKNLVEFGDVVATGEKIAEVGNTGGYADGPTGCHVSFGVVGAKNPFVK